jgi:endonuclease YncB( thermonuclease family)
VGNSALVVTVAVAVGLSPVVTACGDAASAPGHTHRAPATSSAPASTAAKATTRAHRRRHRRQHQHRTRHVRGASARVAYVIDGDTIALTSGPHVRFLQIDTPELSSNECYAVQARGLLDSLLPAGARVTLRKDPALDTVDRYGRLLRYVYRGGTNLNVEMVRRGAAAPYFFDGDRGRFAGRLYALALAAKRAHRGLWGACPATRLAPDAAVTALRAPSSPAGGGSPGGSCEPGYTPCLPVRSDLDCGDIPDTEKPIHVTGPDPYRLDGDGDGIACE